MEDYKGIERRMEEGGRRISDTCSQHCVLVRQWEDKISEIKLSHAISRKEDQKESEDRLKGAAPLWSVLVLITLVAGSLAYTFNTTAKLQTDIVEKMGASNSAIQATLYEIKKDLEVGKQRQENIKELLQDHINKFESEKKSYNLKR